MKNLALFVLICFYSSSKSQQINAPCAEQGFENLSVGTLTSNAWQAYHGYSISGNNPQCPSAGLDGLWTSGGNQYVQVLTTPALDSMCNNVQNSPFSGNKVVCLNKGYLAGMTKLSQTFTVTNTNFVYNYAYKAMLGRYYEPGVCSQNSLLFRFYDCNNNLLSALSKTIIPGTSLGGGPSLYNPDNVYWLYNTAYPNIYPFWDTPNWVAHSVNLSPYIGSCIRVDVIVAPCTCGSAQAYCYYDWECSDKFTSCNQEFIGASTYSSCLASPTIQALPGFSSYLWQGPANSGISGSTLSAVTASANGSYTVSVTSGSLNFSQTFSLNVNSLAPVSIAGNSFVCFGNSLNLQAAGGAITSYTWNTGQNSSSISITPSITSQIYSVSVTNSLGCVSSNSLLVFRVGAASMQIVPSHSPICAGDTLHLSTTLQTYTWSTGAISSSIQVTPTASTVYSVTGLDSYGCSANISSSVTVYALPQVAIVSSNTSICLGQSVNLTAQGSNFNSLLWNTGSQNFSISVSPTINTTYSILLFSSAGCSLSLQQSLQVKSVPLISINGSTTTVCPGQLSQLQMQGTNFNSVLWNNGSSSTTIFVSPTISTNYVATATSSSGCQASASQLIYVHPLSQLQIYSTADTICEGESFNLVASGQNINSYLWNNGQTSASIYDSPLITSVYQVSVTDYNGCSNSLSKIITVSTCTGIENNQVGLASLLQIFPNPNNGSFTVNVGSLAQKVQIINCLGQVIQTLYLNSENDFSTKVSNLETGVYFVRTDSKVSKVVIK